MKLIAHIGMNKAASTTFQNQLELVSNELSDRNIHYDLNFVGKRFVVGQNGNASAIKQAIKNQNWINLKSELITHYRNAARKNCNTVIISNESIWHFLQSNTDIFEFYGACKLAGFEDIRIVLVVRNLYEHAISAFSHRVGHIKPRSFNDWLNEGDMTKQYYCEPQQLKAFLASSYATGIPVECFDISHGMKKLFYKIGLPNVKIADMKSNKSISFFNALYVNRASQTSMMRGLFLTFAIKQNKFSLGSSYLLKKRAYDRIEKKISSLGSEFLDLLRYNAVESVAVRDNSRITMEKFKSSHVKKNLNLIDIINVLFTTPFLLIIIYISVKKYFKRG